MFKTPPAKPPAARKAAKRTVAKPAPAPREASPRPAPMYKRIQTRRAFEEVASQIRDQLSRGALVPGDRLPPERELARQFNLSRNTVREALRSLEMAGILEFRKGMHGGAFVREGHGSAVIAGFADLFRLGMFEPEHLKEARLLVGMAVTRAACRRATDDDIAALRANLEASDAAVRDGRTAERMRLGLEFHRQLAKGSGNPIFMVLTDALMEVQAQLIELGLLSPTPNELVMPSRHRITEFVAARDETKAVAEMERNISNLQLRPLNGKTPTAAAGPARKRTKR
jgi:GntR family transcriptional repressor for pyruvate dehydrogenase complex